MDIQTKDGILLRGIPDGTPDDVIKQRITQIRAQKPEQLGVLDRAAIGVKDITDAGAQLLTKALPRGAVNAVNSATQAVNDAPVIGPITKFLGMTPSTPEQVDQNIKLQEQAYQERKPEGFDFARAGGGLLAGGAALAPVKSAMLAGAIGTAMQPVTGGDYWTEKAKQVGTGVAAGKLGDLAGKALGRVISPQPSAQIKMLMDAGVNPSIGQRLGGMANKVEEKATSIPILGDMITSARGSAIQDFNRVAINRGLDKIGKPLEKGIVGRDAISESAKRIGAAYDELLPTLTGKMDQQFAGEVQKVVGMADYLPDAQKSQFMRIVGDNLAAKFSPNGSISGESIKEAEKTLGHYIRQYGSSPNPEQRELANAISATQQSLRDMVARSNPQKAAELAKINSAFANQVRVEKAAAAVGSREGVFSPEALNTAINALDKSARKNKFAKGDALMQDLADAGMNVLGRKIPDSGTAGRLANIGAIGSAAINPAIPIGLGVGGLAYTAPMQKALVALMTQRPELAKKIAPLLGDQAGLLGLSGGLLGYQAAQ